MLTECAHKQEVEVPSDEMCADDVAVTEITVERGMSSGDPRRS